MGEVEDVLDQMELGIRELPPADRPKYDVRLKSYRADKASLAKELVSALARLDREEARDQLFGSPSASGSNRYLSPPPLPSFLLLLPFPPLYSPVTTVLLWKGHRKAGDTCTR